MTKRELDREISEYEDGKLNRTNARDLAALYIVRDYLFPEDSPNPAAPILTRSFAGLDTVPDYGDSEFYHAIAGKDSASCWHIMNQLLQVLAAVYEPLYRQVMKQLNDI